MRAHMRSHCRGNPPPTRSQVKSSCDVDSGDLSVLAAAERCLGSPNRAARCLPPGRGHKTLAHLQRTPVGVKNFRISVISLGGSKPPSAVFGSFLSFQSAKVVRLRSWLRVRAFRFTTLRRADFRAMGLACQRALAAAAQHCLHRRIAHGDRRHSGRTIGMGARPDRLSSSDRSPTAANGQPPRVR